MKAITFSNPANPRIGFLSNESKHSFILEGEKWLTVEHYIQSKKFEGTSLEEEIRLAPTILMVKKLSSPTYYTYYNEKGERQEKYIYGNKKNTYYIKEDWALSLRDNMKKAIYAKFDQHPCLQKKLLETRNVSLIDLYNPLTGPILEEYRASIRKLDRKKSHNYTNEDLYTLDINEQDLLYISDLFHQFYKILDVVSKYEGWNKIKEEMVEDVVLICVPQKLKKKALKYIKKFSKVDSCTLFNTLPNTNKFLVETELFLNKKLKKNTDEEISNIGLLIVSFFKWLCFISASEENLQEVKIIIEKLKECSTDTNKICIPKIKRSYRLLVPPRIIPGAGSKKPTKQNKLTGTESYYAIDRHNEKIHICGFVLKCIIQGNSDYENIDKVKAYILQKRATIHIRSTDVQIRKSIEIFKKYKPLGNMEKNILPLAKFIKNLFPLKEENLTAFQIYNIIREIYNKDNIVFISNLEKIEQEFGENVVVAGVKKKYTKSSKNVEKPKTTKKGTFKNQESKKKKEDIVIYLDYSDKVHVITGDFQEKYKDIKDEYFKKDKHINFNRYLKTGPGWIIPKRYLSSVENLLTKKNIPYEKKKYNEISKKSESDKEDSEEESVEVSEEEPISSTVEEKSSDEEEEKESNEPISSSEEEEESEEESIPIKAGTKRKRESKKEVDIKIQKYELKKDQYMMPVRVMIEDAILSDRLDDINFKTIQLKYQKLNIPLVYSKEEYLVFFDNVVKSLKNVHLIPSVKQNKDGKIFITGMKIRNIFDSLSEYNPKYAKQNEENYKINMYQIIIPSMHKRFFNKIKKIVSLKSGTDQSKIEYTIDNIVKLKLLDMVRCSLIISRIHGSSSVKLEHAKIYSKIIKCNSMKSYKSHTIKNYSHYIEGLLEETQKHYENSIIDDDAKDYMIKLYSKIMDIYYRISENKTFKEFSENIDEIKRFTKHHSYNDNYEIVLKCIENIYKIVFKNQTSDKLITKLMHISRILLSNDGIKEIRNIFNRLDRNGSKEEISKELKNVGITKDLDFIDLDNIFGEGSNTTENKIALLLILSRIIFEKSKHSLLNSKINIIV